MKNETFFIIKPEVFKNNKQGELLEFIVNKGFKIKHFKIFKAPIEVLEKHYEHMKWKEFFPDLIQYMTSGKIAIGVLEKDNAIEEWRNVIGSTDPTKASPETIRGTFGYIKNGQIYNAVHGSDSYDNFIKELEIWYER